MAVSNAVGSNAMTLVIVLLSGPDLGTRSLLFHHRAYRPNHSQVARVYQEHPHSA